MAQICITFGQSHIHKHGAHTLDKDCVALINAPTNKEADALAFKWFKGKFHQHVPRENWNEEDMHYFSRGYIEVN